MSSPSLESITSSPDSTTSTPSAINGGTYVRTNRKERKGIYFIPKEQLGSEEERKKQEVEDLESNSASVVVVTTSAPTTDRNKMQMQEQGEQVDPDLMDLDLLGQDSSANDSYFRELNDSSDLLNPMDEKRSSLTRNGWQRTSLRKTPNSSLNGEGVQLGPRRWGSFRTNGKRLIPLAASSPGTPSTNALASHLYRSSNSSYHSSGRSSVGDGEEMYSDSSLEGEVIDLTKKVHHLEEKFTVLAENQNDADDRYTRAKQENAELSTKLFMLEEQLRDVETRAEEKLREEQRRTKEIVSRTEREKQLQLENLEIKLQMMEKEISSARIDVKRLENTLEKERNENNRLVDKCTNLDRDVSLLREHNRELLSQNRQDRESMAMENAGSQQALVELKRQLESLSHFHMNGGGSSNAFRRTESTEGGECGELKSRLKEAQEEIKRLRGENKYLQEANEELSAQILNQELENGRNLLDNFNCSAVSSENSLAAELEAMSNDEINEYGFRSTIQSERDSYTKMKNALKDQKEANHALRAYIDNILLNIVENHPHLLEVKNKNRINSENNQVPTQSE